MKFMRLKSLFWAVLVILLVTLACGTSSTTSTEAPAISNNVATAAPAETTSVGASTPDNPFYLEEFDGGLENWSMVYFTGADDTVFEDKTDVYTEDGGLWLDINYESTYIYLFHDLFEYDDVRIETETESLGRNTNYISLVCRYDPDLGWYEFNIAASGLVSILRYDEMDGRYVTIGEGGSTAIKQGKETNNFIARCKGNALTLTINGDEWRTFTDNNLSRGMIGVSAGSENVLPVKIVFNWLDITEP
jgi:hypothetical protein